MYIFISIFQMMSVNYFEKRTTWPVTQLFFKSRFIVVINLKNFGLLSNVWQHYFILHYYSTNGIISQPFINDTIYQVPSLANKVIEREKKNTKKQDKKKTRPNNSTYNNFLFHLFVFTNFLFYFHKKIIKKSIKYQIDWIKISKNNLQFINFF